MSVKTTVTSFRSSTDAEPAAVADVRRDEEPLRVEVDERRLDARRGRAPDREAPVAVVVRQHHQERALAADEERRRAVAESLARLGKRETDFADPRQYPFAFGAAQAFTECTSVSRIRAACSAAARRLASICPRKP